MFTNRAHFQSSNYVATEDAWDNYHECYVCPVCPDLKRFKHISNLQSHFDSGVHDDVRPYECKGCLRTFARMSSLKQHQESLCTQYERLGDLLITDFRTATGPRMIANYAWHRNPESTLYFDGSVRGRNPGLAGSGYCLLDHRGSTIEESGVIIEHHPTSSNQAEYIGLIHGLESAINNDVRDIVVRGDSW